MKPEAKPRPLRFHLLLSFGLAASLTLLLGAAFGWPGSVVVWLLLWLAAINVLACAYYAYDKNQARSQGRRVPELALHALAFAGGSAGAFLGMALFRHKTLKGSFRSVFLAIAACQALLLLGLAKRLWFP